jgi:hypothetical protein
MATAENLTVYIKCDIDTSGFDLAIKKMNKFKKATKMSLWQLIKMKIVGLFLPRPKITIQELIERDHQYKL